MENATNLSSLIKKTQFSSKITRLIAEENIIIEYSTTASTASFHTGTRTLTYPYSMILEDTDIHDLMMHHEIGHAKYSLLEDKWIEAVDNGTSWYVNIIEDIRIERLVKRDYPGCVKNFNEGYKKLMNMEFFGEIKNMPTMSFINRLNIYSKIGPITGHFIKFNEEESAFIKRCNEISSEEEVYELAIVLKDQFDPKQRERIAELLDGETIEIDGDGFIFDEDDEDGELESSSNDKDAEKQQKIEDRLDEDTAEIFKRKMSDTNISDCTVVHFESLDPKYATLYSANEIYKKLLNDNNLVHINSQSQTARKVLSKQVDFMARQFELKKQAFREKHATVSATGKLNVNRIFGYKYTDDVFLSKFKVGDAKNHGMVILLDASGSIMRYWNDMINQVIVVTEFCRKANIPFKVFLFGMNFDSDYIYQQTYSPHIPYIGTFTSREALCEILSSDMPISQYKTMIGAIIEKSFFSLGQTPTVEAMLKLEHIAVKFFDDKSVQVRKLILITDGDPGDGIYTMRNKTSMTVDAKTKKNYLNPKGFAFGQVDIMGQIYKDRHNIDMITIAITDNRGTHRFFNSFGVTIKRDYDKDMAAFKRDNYLYAETPSKSPVFIVKSVNTALEVEDIVINNTKSLSGIANDFKRGLTTIKKNHNFLNILTQYLSQAQK